MRRSTRRQLRKEAEELKGEYFRAALILADLAAAGIPPAQEYIDRYRKAERMYIFGLRLLEKR